MYKAIEKIIVLKLIAINFDFQNLLLLKYPGLKFITYYLTKPPSNASITYNNKVY